MIENLRRNKNKHKMSKNLISAKNLVHAIALVFFIIQMIFAFKKYLAKPTMQSPEIRPFSSLQRPLILTACKQNQFNYTQALTMGYGRNDEFLSGITQNSSMISWTGEKGNLTFEETLDILYDPPKPLNTFGKKLVHIKNVTTQFIIPFGWCQSIKSIIHNTLVRIQLDRDTLAIPSGHLLFISDPAASSTYQLSLTNGDTIILESAGDNHGTFQCYNIQLKEFINEADDGSCIDYPNADHESYSSCVTADMRSRIMPSLGCMVPWIAKEDACIGKLNRLEKHQEIIEWLFKITEHSWGKVLYKPETCLPPCTVLTAHSTFASSGLYKDNLFELYFSPDIQVEKITLAYDSGDLLVEIGSCLGLWLGLSVIGIYDLLLPILIKACKCLNGLLANSAV